MERNESSWQSWKSWQLWNGTWVNGTNGTNSTRHWVHRSKRVLRAVILPPVPHQSALETPRFRVARMRSLSVPHGGVFVSCVDGRRHLCAVRANSSARRVLILKNHNVVNTIDEADDPRVFQHASTYWIMNNNYYRLTMVELFRDGSFGREIRVPIMQGKNLVPLSWSDSHFFMLDIQDKVLWPAQLDDRNAVLIKRPMELTVRRATGMQCRIPASCAARGGSQGVHLHPKDDFAYGAGHCTTRRRVRRKTEVLHHAYWWILNLPRRELVIEGLCGPKRKMVDPTALYALRQRKFSKQLNATVTRLVWIMATTEADEEWNRFAAQPYYNEVYRAELNMKELFSPPPPPPPPRPTTWQHSLVGWWKHSVLKVA